MRVLTKVVRTGVGEISSSQIPQKNACYPSLEIRAPCKKLSTVVCAYNSNIGSGGYKRLHPNWDPS